MVRRIPDGLAEASSGGVMERVREALPADIRQLVSAGSTGSVG